jgi:hypothetical protein
MTISPVMEAAGRPCRESPEPQAFPAFFQDKAPDIAGIVLAPHHKHIGDRAVGDPHLAPVRL